MTSHRLDPPSPLAEPSEAAEHRHGQYVHYHAFGELPHDHFLRQVCGRPDCHSAPTHNIHQVPSPGPSTTGPVHPLRGPDLQ